MTSLEFLELRAILVLVETIDHNDIVAGIILCFWNWNTNFGDFARLIDIRLSDIWNSALISKFIFLKRRV